ncbi:type I restriction enzyme HsdR N-terminal domain-containing protein [Providencia sp. PROV179]|uniref:type I restriction enzyme HsdR N-terminal domain-containing protein n=1 Tax=Providencia sp. PROV179 TaxID=2949882 RepID=UPI002349A904|nr:type I restriction endonuclease [Providencia sp. PROV179]
MKNKDLLIDNEIVTESDVEQHKVYPILTNRVPDGLGLKSTDIITKHNVKGMLIKKRSNRKSYFPDYVIKIDGLPLIVIEVKKPNEDLNEAFSEARLYATEINSLYPKNINPLSKLIVTDGDNWIIGYWDSDEPFLVINEIEKNSDKFLSFIELLKRSSLQKAADKISKNIFPERYFQPIRLVGGEKIQNEEIGLNSFGEQLVSEYRNIFNPNSIEDRRFIAKNAYIPSKQNRRYYDPINKIINSVEGGLYSEGKKIKDSSNPIELLDELKKKKELENKIILLIGSVGSGKTTFIDHFIEEVIPKELKDSLLWIRINMNTSPVSRDELYPWIRTKIIEECIAENKDIDFDDLDTIKKIYSVEINKFNKGVGKLLPDGDSKNEKLFNIIMSLESDLTKKTQCYTRYLGSERNRLVIIVLDNSDKRTRDEQLLMFEIAQWLQEEYRALTILPLRDETYDNHRDQPPLDTAIKDMVFRIEPPLFQDVLHSRVQLILNKMSSESKNRIQYNLPNGYLVDCGKDEKSYYLTSIVRSIFVHDAQIRRIIVGLAGKNIRRALEIFMEFCTSGHIVESEILKIRQQGGSYSLPLYIITRVLLRMKKRYYKSDDSYLKNLFSISSSDENPNYFTRYIILKWYREKHTLVGPSGYKGYFSIRDLKDDLIKYGISEDIIVREVNYLLKGFCLESEKFSTDIVNDEDLLKITSAGFVNLEMISNINYLAAIAEDTNYSSRELALSIADTMRENSNQYDKDVVAKNAKILVDYIKSWQEKYNHFSSMYLSDNQFSDLSDISEAIECVDNFTQRIKNPAWSKFEEKYNIGDIVQGWVKNINPNIGIFVNLSQSDDVTGLVYLTKCPEEFLKKYKINDKVNVRIDNSIDSVNKKVALTIMEGDINTSTD